VSLASKVVDAFNAHHLLLPRRDCFGALALEAPQRGGQSSPS